MFKRFLFCLPIIASFTTALAQAPIAPPVIPGIPGGPVLRAKGWRQEALLRLLENVLAVGEDPAPRTSGVLVQVVKLMARCFGRLALPSRPCARTTGGW